MDIRDQDPALDFSNPRLLSAIYFGLLSVVGTILTNALLTVLGFKEMVPLFQAILLGMVVASATGALFGKEIIYSQKPYKIKVFWLGFIMVIASLPIYALGLLYFIDQSNPAFFAIYTLRDLAYSYLIVLAYSYILFGFLLAVGAGLAALYLRGWLVYDILHTDKRRSMRLPRYVAAAQAKSKITKSDVVRQKEIK